MPRNSHWEEIERRKKDANLREQDPRLSLNWNTGPWINNGKWQASQPHYTPATSAWQQSSKEHDTTWATSNRREDVQKADDKYFAENWGQGPWRSAAAAAVKLGGGILRAGTLYEDDQSTLRGTVKKRPVANLPSGEQAGNSKKQKTIQEVQIGPGGEMTSVGGSTTGTATGVAAARFSGGGGSGGVGGGTMGETPLKPYGPVPLIQPDYTTIRHKWVATIGLASSTGALEKFEFRVNSPIDPNISTTTTTGTGATTNNTNTRFNGFNEMASRYRYYRLIQNKVSITFCRYGNGSTEASAQAQLSNNNLNAGPLAFGYIQNPSNRFEVNSSSITEWVQFAQARFCDWTLVSGATPIKTLSFVYNPGQWDAAISEQQKEKLWTPVDEHQGPDDRICIFAQALQVATDWQAEVVVTMDATIQYREWDNQIVERMFIPDMKAQPRLTGEELAVGATDAFTSSDAAPVPDTYTMEEDQD